ITKPDSLISDLVLGNYIWHKEKHDLPSSNDETELAKLQSLLPWMPKDDIIRRLTSLKKCKPGWLAAGNTLAAKLAAPKPIKLDINSLPRSSAKKDSAGSEAASTDRKSQDSANWDTAVSPKITIHVCDEGKGLKQDFECPKDLLVQEMRYFADYLSSDQQKWEDVDISVHCDVNIFDWLMRYVKRKFEKSNPVGSLEPTNVISILISSDFLKMDNLVDLCISYCHKNMSAILATPCNMSCLSESLVDKIAYRFTDSEVDDIRDKKDKFKSVLFQKKIESLFLGQQPVASSLFQCRHCRQLLTRDTQRRLRCHPTRLCVGPRGAPVYRHETDAGFDVNEHLIEQKQQLGSWRTVYWRLWGHVNALDCVRCGGAFACAQLGHCAYHASPARFEFPSSSADEEVLAIKSPRPTPVSKLATNSLGVYPCCGVKTLRFDPFRLSTGCKFRDHVISSANEDATRAATLPTKAESAADSDEGDAEADGGSCGPPLSVQQILLAKRDAVCVPPPEKPEERSLADVDIFDNEYLLLYPTQKPKQQKHLHTSRSSAAAAVLEPLCVDEDHRGGAGGDTDASDDSGEDECTGDAEDAGAGRQQPRGKVGGSGAVGCANKSEKKPARQRVTLQTGAILLHAPSFSCKKSGRWDANRSSRANQDYQRQDDRRRMSQIMDYLVKLRTATAGDNQRTQPEKAAKQKEYSGGMYAKLEAQFKATHSVSAGANKVPPMNPRPLERPKTSGPRTGGKI
ncbi:hypothetical protein BOX15_Mlig025688g1, partial [Macrostomum lignano]